MKILCLSTSNYYPFPTRKQNVMNRFKEAEIIYVDPPVTLIAPLKDKKTLPRLKAFKLSAKTDKENPHIKIYAAPPVLPFYNKKRLINRINQKMMSKWLAKICKENGFKDDFLLWCYSPMSVDVVEALAKKLKIDPKKLWKNTIYDCVDRHSAYPGMINPLVVDKEEEELAHSCGTVFATAKGLFERLKNFNANSYFIPNGASYELFSKTAALKKEGISPHFGFVGMLQECIDYSLIEALAKNYPQGKITLIGRSLPGVDLSWMSKYPNIENLGLLPQKDLPEHIKDFDVCLNLFLDNELSKDVSPLKFYEYLATGKPIVSTPVPYQVRDYEDCIYIAENKEDFLKKCEEALKEPKDSPLKKLRMEKALECSWDKRVDEMRKILLYSKQ